MDVRDCVPAHKFDTEAIVRAEAVGFPALNDVIPELLKWLQDYNWPVAKPTACLLAGAGPEIVEPIRTALESNDDMWKYWIITQLYPRLDSSVRAEIRPILVEISHRPALGEDGADVAEAAREAFYADREDLRESDRLEQAVRVDEMDWRGIQRIARDYLRLLIANHASDLGLKTEIRVNATEFLDVADGFFGSGDVSSVQLARTKDQARQLWTDLEQVGTKNDETLARLVWSQLWEDLDPDTMQDPVWFLQILLLTEMNPSYAHEYVDYFIKRVRTDYPDLVEQEI